MGDFYKHRHTDTSTQDIYYSFSSVNHDSMFLRILGCVDGLQKKVKFTKILATFFKCHKNPAATFSKIRGLKVADHT